MLASQEWSKEEDEKILDLKKQNKTWKEIVAAFEGKFLQRQLRDRFKELHKEEHNDNDKKDDSKPEAPKKDAAQGKNPAESVLKANENKPVGAPNSERTRLVKDLPQIQFLDGEELSSGQACLLQSCSYPTSFVTARLIIDLDGDPIPLARAV